jgi:ribokinase
VGSINSDLVATADRIPAVGETVIGSGFQVHPGGKGANQAVAVARLGYPVEMMGRLGSDSFGQELRAHMQSVGVDCSGVAESEGASGVAVILVSGKGENCIVVSPGANGLVAPEDLDAKADKIRRAGVVLAQLEIPLKTVEYLATLCRRHGVPLILDPAPARELPEILLENVAWLTPNEMEAAFYAGGHGLTPEQTANALLARGCGGVVLKLGAQGAYLQRRGEAGQFVPAFPVDAVDSTAAGDAFNGGFATGLMLGKPPREAARFAAAVAAISVTRAGAQPSMPTMTEVEQFLSDQPAG